MINKIVNWNKERLLDKQEFKFKVEILNILEELIEATRDIESSRARLIAKNIYELYFEKNNIEDKERIIDAFADIVVFSIGAILKLGYNPECVMNEVIKEIESRKGRIINGKFIKDISEEAKKNWYKADFSKCKNK